MPHTHHARRRHTRQHLLALFTLLALFALPLAGCDQIKRAVAGSWWEGTWYYSGVPDDESRRLDAVMDDDDNQLAAVLTGLGAMQSIAEYLVVRIDKNSVLLPCHEQKLRCIQNADAVIGQNEKELTGTSFTYTLTHIDERRVSLRLANGTTLVVRREPDGKLMIKNNNLALLYADQKTALHTRKEEQKKSAAEKRAREAKEKADREAKRKRDFAAGKCVRSMKIEPNGKRRTIVTCPKGHPRTLNRDKN